MIVTAEQACGRCAFTASDGTTAVVEPSTLAGVATVVVDLAGLSLVGPGLIGPPTRFWRRVTWLVLSAGAPVGLLVAAAVVPEPAQSFLFVFAVCVGFALVFAVLTAAVSYGIHPGTWWWLFPGAWLGWTLAFTTLALVIWVLAS